MTVCNEGIRIIVDDQHHEQGSAYFKYDQFSEFTLRSGTVHIRIPMTVFMVFLVVLFFKYILILKEALNVFASNSTALRMYYEGEGEPLIICMEDEGIVFNCAINTQIPSPVFLKFKLKN